MGIGLAGMVGLRWATGRRREAFKRTLKIYELPAGRGPGVDHTVGTAKHSQRDARRDADGRHTSDLHTNAPQRPGGQGVVGSNPAVPTQVRGLIEDLA
jgi:hypothetical protein